MKNKEQKIGGCDVLPFQLEMLQTAKCIFVFFPSGSWRWASQLCLGQKMSVQPISQLLSAHRPTQPPPAPSAARRENGVTRKSEVLTILSHGRQRRALRTRPALLIKSGARPEFSPGERRHLTESSEAGVASLHYSLKGLCSILGFCLKKGVF